MALLQVAMVEADFARMDCVRPEEPVVDQQPDFKRQLGEEEGFGLGVSSLLRPDGLEEPRLAGEQGGQRLRASSWYLSGVLAILVSCAP